LYGTVTGLLGNFGIDLNGITSKITGTIGGLMQKLSGSLSGNGSLNIKSLFNIFN
jgi:hypothetical protein